MRGQKGSSLPTWQLQIFHGTENLGTRALLTADELEHVQLIDLRVDNLSNLSHNELMCTHWLWARRRRRVLIFPTDSLICRTGVDEFRSWDTSVRRGGDDCGAWVSRGSRQSAAAAAAAALGQRIACLDAHGFALAASGGSSTSRQCQGAPQRQAVHVWRLGGGEFPLFGVTVHLSHPAHLTPQTLAVAQPPPRRCSRGCAP